MIQCNKRRWVGFAAIQALGLALLALGLTAWSGCGAGNSGGEAATPPEGQPAKGDSGAKPSADALQEYLKKAAAKYKLPEQAPTTAQGVLEAMVAAYKLAPSYQDAGELRFHLKQAGRVTDEALPFSVSMVRPNKLRLEVYRAKAIWDGVKCHAAISELPQQVLDLDAPAELTVEAVCRDNLLTRALVGGPASGAPQLLLLLDDDPLKGLLHESARPELLEPAKIDDRTCYRVAVNWPDGKGVLWIDQKDYVMRRIEFPTDELAKMMAGGGPVEELTLTADLHGASLGGKIDPTAFEFQVPADAKLVKSFVPPDPRQIPDMARLLSKAVPEFKFTDLAGQTITTKSLEGKIVYLDFWGTQCEPCRELFPKVEKVYQKYKDNPKVAFLAVSVDPPSVEAKTLQDVMAALGASMPIARDLEGVAGEKFWIPGIPTSFLIGPDGRVQDFEAGANPNVEADLSGKIEKLLAGQDIFQAGVAEFQQRVQRYEEALKQAIEGKMPNGAVTQEQQVPRAEIAPKSDPKVLKLSPLWKFTDATAPGNLLVAPRADGPPRIMVLDNLKRVVELGPDGKAVATHELDLQPTEVASFLITGAGADGKRLFGAVAVQQQRVHVYDEAMKPLLHFPEDALKDPHPGIYDALLADLDGDGALDLYVSYWDAVGVQGVGLDGNRKWAYRQVSNVARLAVGGPDAQGKRLLWCTHDRGSLLGLDSKGERQAEVMVRGRPLYAAFASDLTGDGQPEWCGVCILEAGRTMMVGFNLKGEELWTHEMPPGLATQPIEPVAAGRLSASGPGCWIFPGADGSITLVGPDGKLIDQFHYGATLSGIATATIDGHPVLLVSTPKSVEAWKVEP